MIAFDCQQCGRRHERPDDTAGTLVFCTCGHGNLVPRASAAAVPEAPAARSDDVAPVLQALPVADPNLDFSPQPGPLLSGPDVTSSDPACCFNHPDALSQHACVACGLSFCERCVVRLQGQLLCGPCKNYRIRHGQRPPRTSVMAIFSLVTALVGGPFSFCLLSIGVAAQEPGLGFVGLLVPLVALGLGIAALRTIERDAQVGGRSLALTGIVAGGVSTIAMGMMIFLVGRLAG